MPLVLSLKSLNRERDKQTENNKFFDIILKECVISGVITDTGIKFYSKTVIFTFGTFLGGKIFIGQSCTYGGRIGDMSAIKLSDKFKNIFP